MWAEKSEVTTVKERQGTRVEHRKDLEWEIRNSCKYAGVAKGIVALAINLLPYFKPSRTIATAAFPIVKSKTKEYFAIVRTNRALKAMAWYVRKVPFRPKEVVVEHLDEMARGFEESGEFQLNADEGMTGITSAIRDYKLVVGEKKASGKMLVEGFEQLLLCEFARQVSDGFEVPHLECEADGNRQSTRRRCSRRRKTFRENQWTPWRVSQRRRWRRRLGRCCLETGGRHKGNSYTFQVQSA
jgi:hypothetical protein